MRVPGSRRCAKMKKGVNIESVAKASGFSKATVSRVMRNDPRVAPRTRRIILEMVEEMGYRPNPLVAAHMRNVRMNKQPEVKETVGLITFLPREVRWQNCPSQRRMIQGIYDRAAEIGFKIEEFPFAKSGMTSRRLNGILTTRGIQGLIVAPMHHGFHNLELDWKHFSMVTMGVTVQNPNLHRVRSDNFHNLYVAMEKLTQFGYRRIGLVVDTLRAHTPQEMWLGGFLTYVMARFGASRIPPLFIDPSEDSATPEFAAQLGDYVKEHRIDAVVGYEFVLDALIRAKVAVPEDCAYANLHILDNKAPSAGMDERSHELGLRATDLLADLLYRNESGVPAQPQTTLIGGAWVDGWTAPPLRGRAGSEAVGHEAK